MRLLHPYLIGFLLAVIMTVTMFVQQNYITKKEYYCSNLDLSVKSASSGSNPNDAFEIGPLITSASRQLFHSSSMQSNNRGGGPVAISMPFSMHGCVA